MIEVILVIHLILAIAIVALVLMQRSEGGALGMGGGGSSFGGLVSGRAAGNILTKATATLAGLFMLTSLGLTILAGQTGEQRSIVEDVQSPPAANQPVAPSGPQVPTSQ